MDMGQPRLQIQNPQGGDRQHEHGLHKAQSTRSQLSTTETASKKKPEKLSPRVTATSSLPEPANATLFGNSVFADILMLR